MFLYVELNAENKSLKNKIEFSSFAAETVFKCGWGRSNEWLKSHNENKIKIPWLKWILSTLHRWLVFTNVTMPSIKDTSIVKIAVKPFSSEPQYVPQLIEFDQRQPLSTIIKELCLSWNMSEWEDYSLKFTDSSFDGYVNEKNRNLGMW